MNGQEALREIQRMHAEKTVRRESIVAWYRFYARKLPTMHPERSDVDLIRTIALWMELTDRGGSPGFPYDYKSLLQFSTVKPQGSALPSLDWLLCQAVAVIGVIVLFFNWKIGLSMIAAGLLLEYVGYRLRGGPTNPDLIMVDQEGRRVLEWATRQHGVESADG